MTWREIRFKVQGHNTTLKRIFEEPPATADLKWRQIKHLFDECNIIWRSVPDNGTSLISRKEIIGEIKTPENDPPTSGTIRKIRDSLTKIGTTPASLRQFLGGL